MADVKTQPSLLLLIPAYNEEERIGPVLRGYAAVSYTHLTLPTKA